MYYRGLIRRRFRGTGAGLADGPAGGAPLLVLYGGANTVVCNAVLAGVIRQDAGYDRAAAIGHAWFWNPLFLVWGVALLGYLVLACPASARRAV